MKRIWETCLLSATTYFFGAGICQAELMLNWTNRSTAGFSETESAVIDASLKVWSDLLPTSGARAVNLSFSRAPLIDSLGSTGGWQFDSLGNPTGATIQIDSLTSFFVDPTPLDNGEYTPSGHPAHFNATGGGAVGMWDLLSVAVHEVGHAIGIARAYDRFLSRTPQLQLVSPPDPYTYYGQDFSATFTHSAHLADNYDLMGFPGFGFSERALPSPLDLDILNDAYDYKDTKIYEYGPTPAGIPDFATRSFSLHVGDDQVITDVDVALRITHPFPTDLDISLISPQGTRVELSTDNGGSGFDYGSSDLWARFDDEAIAFPVQNYRAPFEGSFVPEGRLASIDGESTLGDWILEVIDDDPIDFGTLQGFELIFTTIPPSAIAGDYNGNGVVDAVDYNVWRDTLGATGIGLAADGNGNNVIDSADYDVWRSHFGQTAGGGAAIPGKLMPPAVPEPASVILISLGLAACSHVRHRHTNAHASGQSSILRNLTQLISPCSLYPTARTTYLFVHSPGLASRTIQCVLDNRGGGRGLAVGVVA